MKTAKPRIVFACLRDLTSAAIGEVNVTRWLARHSSLNGCNVRLASVAQLETLLSLGIRSASQARVISLKFGGVDTSLFVANGPLSRLPANEVASFLVKEIQEFRTTHLVINATHHCEVLCQVLESLAEHSDVRCFMFVHNLRDLPFGPHSSYLAGSIGAKRIRDVFHILAGFIGPSDFAVSYIGTHTKKPTCRLYPIEPNSPTPPILGSLRNRFVTFVNPCEEKGLSIFLDLVRASPTRQFAAVRSWGTDDKVVDTLKREPNITVLPTTRDMNEVYAQTSVIVMPSRVFETFGLVALEAKLRGIPVMASNLGGLLEATIDGRFVFCVNPLVGKAKGNTTTRPSQIDDWVERMNWLTHNSEHYENESNLARRISVEFVKSLSVKPLLTFLHSH